MISHMLQKDKSYLHIILNYLENPSKITFKSNIIKLEG